MTEENKDKLTKNELLAEQLQKLLKAQSTRMELYSEFDIAFKDYLQGKCPADQYHSICKIVTEGFQDVSQEIQTIEKEMSDTVIAGITRALQQGEKERLEKTVKIQILTIQAKESEKDYDGTIKELQDSLQIINEKNQEIWDELREEMHGVSSLVC